MVVSGSTKLTVSGSVSGEGNSIVVKGQVVVGTLHVKATASVKMGSWIDWEVASVSKYLFKGQTFNSETTTLVSF